MPKNNSADYDVGYRKPPKSTRFKKGHSGNPTGRAKSVRNLKTELGEELAEAIQIREQGKAKKVTKQRALIKALTARALQGDAKSATLIFNMVFKLFHPEMAPESLAPLAEEDKAIIEGFFQRRQSPESGEDK